MVSVTLKRLKGLLFVDHSLSGFSAIISDYKIQQRQHDDACTINHLQYDDTAKAVCHEDQRCIMKILYTSVGLKLEGTIRAGYLSFDGG